MIDFDALMNLEVAESFSFEPLPKGQYKVTVDACELGESKKGNAMYIVDFIVNEGDCASRQIRYWQNLTTQKGLHWLLPDFCNASGNAWPDEPTARNANYYNQVALDLVGKTATITVEIDDNDGKPRNNIKKVEWDQAKAKAKKKSKASKIVL